MNKDTKNIISEALLPRNRRVCSARSLSNGASTGALFPTSPWSRHAPVRQRPHRLCFKTAHETGECTRMRSSAFSALQRTRWCPTRCSECGIQRSPACPTGACTWTTMRNCACPWTPCGPTLTDNRNDRDGLSDSLLETGADDELPASRFERLFCCRYLSNAEQNGDSAIVVLSSQPRRRQTDAGKRQGALF